MASTGPTNSINDQAAEWAVEAIYGSMTAESRADLEAWLSADTRHRGAYLRARAWLLATEDAVLNTEADTAPAGQTGVLTGSPLPSDNDNDHANCVDGLHPIDLTPAKTQPLKQGVMRWGIRTAAGGSALAASVAVLIGLGMPLPALFQEGRNGAHEAQVQIVTLDDGSKARLSPDARIQVTLSHDVRNITLLSGEATFDVAHDKSRPFVVQAGQVYAQAVGTVYSVGRVGRTGGTVKVSEGTVLVWPGDERDQAVRLLAGGTVTLDPGPLRTATEPGTAVPQRRPAPDMAQISLDNVSIASAVTRFNRVNSTKIIIADPQIGEERIIGHYNANDPVKFAHSVAVISDAYVEYDRGNIVIKLE